MTALSHYRLPYSYLGLQSGKKYSRKQGKGWGKFDLKSVIEVLEEHGLDPIEEIVKVLEKGEIKDEISVRAWLELANYVHPKKKAVELTGDGGGPLMVSVVNYANSNSK